MTRIDRSRQRVRWAVLALLLSLAAVVACWVIMPTAAVAADGDDTVTWSVAPADGAGADGRAWVEVELDPGAVSEQHLAVTNHGAAATTFRLTAADGYLTESGRFNMLASAEPSVDAGTWISMAESVTVAPGETAVVPFTISVPEDATAGDHPAGVAASVLSDGVDADGSTVSVESRVGFRVMTRVTGELHVAVAATEATASYEPSWNPFQPGTLTTRVRVVNSGDVAVAVDAAMPGGAPAPADEAPLVLFPGDERTITRTVSGVWPLFVASASMTLTPQVAGDAEPTAPVVHEGPVTVSVSAPAVPWSQLALVVGVTLVLLGLFAGRRRQRRRVEQLVAEARAEGRAQAHAEGALV